MIKAQTNTIEINAVVDFIVNMCQKQLKALNILIGKLKGFYMRIKPVIEKREAISNIGTKYITYEHQIDDYYKLIINLVLAKELAENNITTFCKVLFQYISLLKSIENNINIIRSLFEPLDLKAIQYSTELSQTYMLETYVLQNTFENEYLKYKKQIFLNKNFYDYSAQFIISQWLNNNSKTANNENITNINLTDFIKSIRNYYIKYPLTTTLYAAIIQAILNINIPTITKFIKYILEHDKTMSLYDPHIQQTKKNNNELSSSTEELHSFPFKQTFGLLPKTTYMLLANLLELALGIKNNISQLNNLQHIISLKEMDNIDIICIQKLIQQPIEYNITKLIPQYILHDDKGKKDIIKAFTKTSIITGRYEIPGKNNSVNLSNDGMEGIDKTLVDKYSTIKRLSPISTSTSTSSKVNKLGYYFDIMHYSAKNIKDQTNKMDIDILINLLHTSTTTKFLVLETIDNVSYRILVPDISNESILLDSSSIVECLTFGENHKFSRVGQYNKLIMQQATKTMFFNTPVDMNKLEQRSKIHESKFLRNSLFNEIINIYLDIVDKEPKKGIIEDAAVFSKIIHHPFIYERFIEAILFYYNEYLSTNMGLIQNFKFSISELLVSFLGFLNNLAIEFRKEMHNQFIKYDFPNDLYSKPSATIFRRVFESIVLASLFNIINDDSNIYQTIAYKYQKLTI